MLVEPKSLVQEHEQTGEWMLELFLYLLLGTALFMAPALLLWREQRFGWARYILAVIPVAYTWAGWRLGIAAYDYFDCQGGPKNIHACFAAGIDVTALVGHGHFLSIPLIVVALPLALWFLVDTAVKQIGHWNRQV